MDPSVIISVGRRSLVVYDLPEDRLRQEPIPSETRPISPQHPCDFSLDKIDDMVEYEMVGEGSTFYKTGLFRGGVIAATPCPHRAMTGQEFLIYHQQGFRCLLVEIPLFAHYLGMREHWDSGTKPRQILEFYDRLGQFGGFKQLHNVMPTDRVAACLDILLPAAPDFSPSPRWVVERPLRDYFPGI